MIESVSDGDNGSDGAMRRRRSWLDVLAPAVRLGIGVAVIVLVPALVTSNSALFRMTTVAMWMTMGLAWNWVAGFTGRIDMGFGGYYAIGAYSTAYLVGVRDWSVVPALVVAVALATVFAALVAVAFLRLRGMSYSIATLCVYLAIEQIPPISDPLGGGAGITVLLDIDRVQMWYLFSALALTAIVATVLLRRSQFGLSLLAIREDELSADARGVRLAATQVVAAAMTGALMGVVGGFWAIQNGFVSPPVVFTVSLLTFVLIVVLVGGIGTVYGPVAGAFVFVLGADYLWSKFLSLHDLVLAVALMLLALFLPHGLSRESLRNGRIRARWLIERSRADGTRSDPA